MDRVKLKLAGKENFKKSYGKSVGICLLPVIPTFIAYFIIQIWLISNGWYKGGNYKFSTTSPVDKSSLTSFLVLAGIISLVLGLVVLIIEVMINKFFLMNRNQSSGKVFSFKGSEYFKILGGMFLKELYEALWALLFIIPGLIKSFSYFMVPYILAENPNIGANRAITISKQTMKGAKWDLFVFYLSFIGWYCLGSITFGILNIFYVGPYLKASEAEFYCNMKQKAKELKICTEKELA